ncbi:Molybdopterin binding domain protein [Syntrophobacter sp. SbD1]|nr:Molybdopterin binding domain protein [Syntrophobacter sp. SbD1]
MEKVPIQKAVGMVLAHDVTRIVPGEFKGRLFKKGHVIEATDVPAFLEIGKEHVYVFDLEKGLVHENEAALRLARIAAGPGIELSEPDEGKVTLSAGFKGLLKVNAAALYEVNSIDQVVFSTLHTNQAVDAGRAVAGTRVIPLAVKEGTIRRAEQICASGKPLIEVKPFRSFNVGLVTTGNEIFHGRIEDKFGPIVRAKFAELGSTVIGQELVSDDVAMTVRAIHHFLEQGAGMIALTGGMSVDPDDQTPNSIRAAGGEVVTYGAPVLPGSMFMLAYIGQTPVLGLPGCVMYHKASIFDLVVPRILAGERITREEIVAMGHGGFCSNCPDCRFPVCGFGK